MVHVHCIHVETRYCITVCQDLIFEYLLSPVGTIYMLLLGRFEKLDLVFQNSRQGSEFLKPGVPSEDLGLRNVSTMPPPKKLIQSTSNGIPPHPPRMMPPPPPKFPSPPRSQKADSSNSITKKPTNDPVPGSTLTISFSLKELKKKISGRN